MSSAPNYTPLVGFATEETNSVAGRSTVRTVAIDNELANISSSINGLNTNIKKLQRDDGKLNDGLIEPYALSEQSRSLIASGGTPKGNWVINTNYSIGDAVQYSSTVYLCITAHNSGSSFTSGLWLAISGDGSSFVSAANSAASASAAATSATNASNSASAAATSATNASNSASAAATSATNAANSIAGSIAGASQAEAEGGVENSKFMSSLRVKQAIQFFSALKGLITSSGLTQSTGKLLGRTTAATGAIEEITVGAGLTLSAGTLSNSVSNNVTSYSITNTSDITINLTDTATGIIIPNVNIPASGRLTLSIPSARFLAGGANTGNIFIGIKVNGVIYKSQYNSNGTIADSVWHATVTASTYEEWVSENGQSQTTGNIITFDVATLGIATGSQSVELILKALTTAFTLKGTARTTKMNLQVTA
jgi:hypothetical protein